MLVEPSAANDDTSSDVKLDQQKVFGDSEVETAKEDFDNENETSKKTPVNTETDDFSSVIEEETINELDEEMLVQQALVIRRRKRPTKLSDNEVLDDDEEEFELSDEDETEDIEDEEEESYDEAEEGQLADAKSIDDATNRSLPEDEREIGDGQVCVYACMLAFSY